MAAALADAGGHYGRHCKTAYEGLTSGSSQDRQRQLVWPLSVIDRLTSTQVAFGKDPAWIGGADEAKPLDPPASIIRWLPDSQSAAQHSDSARGLDVDGGDNDEDRTRRRVR